MTVSTFHTYHFTKFSFHPSPISASAFRPIITAETLTIPARDRVIDFGKHKGKMLGTLPSTYLKWVSKNLRARDFQDWAKLADQVLEDPVYQDRIEWEFADAILRGNTPTYSSVTNGVVSELLEISERFGWDNEDKSGWRNVKFELLGTSKGGRIPRLNTSETGLKARTENVEGVSEGQGGGGRRRVRRERVRVRREREAVRIESETKTKIEVEEDGMDGILKEDMLEKRRNRFPGRETLLRNVVLNRRRY